jgi:DnaJ-class molecular chaperone
MSTSASLDAVKLSRPIGICPRCYAVIRSAEELHKKCARPVGARGKCPGVIRTAVAADEWSECPDCRATGRTNSAMCARCKGEGWLYDKRRLARGQNLVASGHRSR